LEILLESVQVVLVPSRVEVVGQAFRESCVVQHQRRPQAIRVQFKLHDGVNARVPRRRTPCLYDALVGDQLDISSENLSAKERERAAFLRVDLGRHPAKGYELLWIQQGLVDPLWANFELRLIVQRSSPRIR